MGLNISVSRLGSVVAGFLYPPLYNMDNNLFLPLFLGMLICGLSWVIALCIIYMDRKAGNIILFIILIDE
jgi:hypothetical protein